MSDTQMRRQQQQHQQEEVLALGKLRSVQWVAEQRLVKTAYQATKRRYVTLRQLPLIGLTLVLPEMYVVWWWSFVHNLPWPAVVLSTVSRADGSLLRLLTYTQQKLEWWWDVFEVRLMWLKESFLFGLERYVTFIDSYLLPLQDRVFGVLSYFLRPFTSLYKVVSAPPEVKKQQQQQQSQQRTVGLTEDLLPRRPVHLESEEGDDDDDDDAEDDNDDTGGDDYPSDASNDSKRRTFSHPKGGRESQQGVGRAAAEVRLKEAMYKRVKKELRVMRKNSIRFSYGIVTYARQIMAPRVEPYAVSFQDYCQKWAREYEIQEVTAPLREEWNSDKRPLGKVLALVRALCVVCLASLLRLVKGKKSRRTRSMRSESLRRRAPNLASTPCPKHPLSPSSALQQSSEPAPPTPLTVQGVSLRAAALKEEEDDDDEDSEDTLAAKDSALGSELDTNEHSSDHDLASTTIREQRRDSHQGKTSQIQVQLIIPRKEEASESPVVKMRQQLHEQQQQQQHEQQREEEERRKEEERKSLDTRDSPAVKIKQQQQHVKKVGKSDSSETKIVSTKPSQEKKQEKEKEEERENKESEISKSSSLKKGVTVVTPQSEKITQRNRNNSNGRKGKKDNVIVSYGLNIPK